MSGPVPVGTAALSFCSVSRSEVLKTVHFTSGWALEYAFATAS